MWRHAQRLILLLVFLQSLSLARAQVLTVQVGSPAPPPVNLVNADDIWRWRKGTNWPGAGWQSTPEAALDATWLSGAGGFGYSSDTVGETNNCRTILTDMQNAYSTLYFRRSFELPEAVDPGARLQLTMDFDDGFVAYLDGVEIRRSNVPGTSGVEPTNTVLTTATHESSLGSSGNAPAVYDLGLVGSRLGAGTHTLAILGVNGTTRNSSDFIMVPKLTVINTSAGAVPNNGLYAITTTNTLLVSGSNTLVGSTRVAINGDDVSFNQGAGTWSGMLNLRPGMNHLYVAALDASGQELGHQVQNVIYETSRYEIGGTLPVSTQVRDRGTVLYVTNTLFVPTNMSFEVMAGVIVLVSPNQGIFTRAGGRISVQGTFEDRVFFNINGASNTFWGPLSGTGTNASIQVHFADISRAQINATTNAYGLFEDSAVHDFDPGAVGTLNRPIMHCNFASLFEARRLHIYNYYECLVRNGIIQVEQCLFEHISGDALDFDSAQPGSYTRNCTYRHGNRGNVDAVDIGPGDLPGSTDTRIENNIMWDFPFDKGVSVGDDNSSHGIIVSNCLIYACNAGVMSKSLCDVSVVNCTIVGNDSGLTNYNKANPASATGGGITTNTYNNIIWGNIATIGLANNGQIFADHNLLGNTNWPGEGNFDADPLFVNPAAHDYRLQAGSPALAGGRNGEKMGITYPLGGIPMPPLRLAASSSTNGVALSWEDDSQNEDAVIVQRSADGVAWQTITTLAPETTNYLDAAGEPGQKYYYRAQHTNYISASPYSNLTSGQRGTDVLFVGGALSSSTVWPAGVTVIVTSSVTVASSATLTIEPCVKVLFNQGLSLTVNGLLLAEGSPDCRIVFTTNAAAGATTWSTIDLFNAASTHRLSYCDLNRSTGNIDATGTAIIARNIWWTNTTTQLLDLQGSSVELHDCYIPGGAGIEPVHFSSMPANGYALIKNNIFGAPQGYNDSLDFTGGNRPGPIIRFIDNVFLGAVDDVMDLDATDAHIEGNIFLNIHQDAVRASTANAIATGEGTGDSEVVIVRNIFYNCDHALLLKDAGSAIFENNTVVTIETNQFSRTPAAYMQFGEPHRGVPGGRGVLMNGNILWDLRSDTPFLAFTNGTMFMVANDNIIQGTNMAFGGNSTADPLFVNGQAPLTYQNIRSNLALLPGSPALGSGPNGLDRGALVPAGASISGEPVGTTTNTSATLRVAGPGIYAYRWKLNDGPWSPEVPLTNSFLITATMFDDAAPIQLNGLSNGTYTVSVIGMNSAGSWQDTNAATVSRTWTVGAPVVTDTDGDGLPDEWELANGLDKDNPADAALDADGDGLSGWQEFLAGTSPTNAASRLAVTIDSPANGAVGLQFEAISNRSYSLLYRTSLSTGDWVRLQDFPATVTNRPIQVFTNLLDAERFFRIVTPQLP